MPRLTITLTPERHRALKETTARTNETIRSLVEESLDAYGVKTMGGAAALVKKARERSKLMEGEALKLARSETRAHRGR